MKKITFTYNDKEYTLEFNRKTVKECGVSVQDLQDLEKDPMSALEIIPRIWCYAFKVHHDELSEDECMEIYDNMTGKDEKLVEALVGIYVHPLETLFAKEGNVKWKKNWK